MKRFPVHMFTRIGVVYNTNVFDTVPFTLDRYELFSMVEIPEIGQKSHNALF